MIRFQEIFSFKIKKGPPFICSNDLNVVSLSFFVCFSFFPPRSFYTPDCLVIIEKR